MIVFAQLNYNIVDRNENFQGIGELSQSRKYFKPFCSDVDSLLSTTGFVELRGISLSGLVKISNTTYHESLREIKKLFDEINCHLFGCRSLDRCEKNKCESTMELLKINISKDDINPKGEWTTICNWYIGANSLLAQIAFAYTVCTFGSDCFCNMQGVNTNTRS